MVRPIVIISAVLMVAIVAWQRTDVQGEVTHACITPDGEKGYCWHSIVCKSLSTRFGVEPLSGVPTLRQMRAMYDYAKRAACYTASSKKLDDPMWFPWRICCAGHELTADDTVVEFDENEWRSKHSLIVTP